MYFPPATEPSLAGEDIGVWALADHQRIISLLTMGLGVLYHREKKIVLEPLPETMLDECKASPVPDVSLCDNKTDQTPIIIEVCHTKGLKDDVQKVTQLIDSDLYGIREGFIYNYKTHEWLRYRFGDGGLTMASSYSDILGLDLNDFL